VEASTHLHRVITSIKEKGKKAGVSLNPATPLSAVEQILPEVDLLLVMTVNPGFGGQKLIEGMIDKIRRARDLVRVSNPAVMLEVDGGITLANIRAVREAGADIVVAGASVFGSGDYGKTIGEMRALTKGQSFKPRRATAD